MNGPAVIAVASLGAVLGDQIGYVLGRWDATARSMVFSSAERESMTTPVGATTSTGWRAWLARSGGPKALSHKHPQKTPLTYRSEHSRELVPSASNRSAA